MKAPRARMSRNMSRRTIITPLAPKSSALVLELWFTLPQCDKKQVAQVASAQREVVKHQAEENQNEFVDLFKTSIKVGLKSHVLVPSCDDYGRILDAGAGDIQTMLELIARLSGDKAEKLTIVPIVEQFTVPPAPTAGLVHDHPDGVTSDAKVVPAGTVSDIAADAAIVGPALATVML